MASDSQLFDCATEAGEQLLSDLNEAALKTQDWTSHDAFDCVKAAIDRTLDRLAGSDRLGKTNRIASNRLWQVAGSLLERGDLQRRAREKPRGYGGDFQLLDKIDRQVICNDPLGGLFDRYFQQQSAPQAVRNRVIHVANLLADLVSQQRVDTFHVVSVGAGPGLDTIRALKKLAPQVRRALRLSLLDLDPAALEFAKEGVLQYVKPAQVRTLRENLFRLPDLDRVRDQIEQASFVSCLGLFDYLSDVHAKSMLSWLYDVLRPKGELVVFNFSPTNRTRAYMEWIANWYLVYRNENQMRQLASAAGVTADVGSEATGDCLYLHAVKK